jgi:hypothetical protein
MVGGFEGGTMNEEIRKSRAKRSLLGTEGNGTFKTWGLGGCEEIYAALVADYR